MRWNLFLICLLLQLHWPFLDAEHICLLPTPIPRPRSRQAGATHARHCNTISAAQLQPRIALTGSHSHDLGGRLSSVHLSHSNLIHAHETCCIEQRSLLFAACCGCVLQPAVALDETSDRTDYSRTGPVTGPSLDRWPVRASQTGTGPVSVPRSVRSLLVSENQEGNRLIQVCLESGL